MKTSDASISSTSLVGCSGFDPNRFLKLPMDRFLERDGVEAIEPQIAIINAINDDRYRFITACLARRTGKTYVANKIASLKLMEPGVSVLIISPNYSLSNISWMAQTELFKQNGIETVKLNAKDREAILENGSFLKLASVGMANSAVGRSYDLILFDEAALDDKGRDAFNIQLRPTLDKPNSKAIFISTPRGSNYFESFYDRGWDDEYPQWFSVHATWKDNPRASEKDITEAKKAMSRAEFQQEYEANFTVFEGQIYEGFDLATQVQDLSSREWPESQYDSILGVDAGYRDETAAAVIKYSWDEDMFYVVEDYEKKETTTEAHARVFARMFDEWDIDIAICDSAAAQFRQDLAALHDIPTMPSTKSVLDGITYVQALVDNRKITVDASCTHVIAMMLNYRWDDRNTLIKSKPLHNKYSHMADALRYALYSFSR